MRCTMHQPHNFALPLRLRVGIPHPLPRPLPRLRPRRSGCSAPCGIFVVRQGAGDLVGNSLSNGAIRSATCIRTLDIRMNGSSIIFAIWRRAEPVCFLPDRGLLTRPVPRALPMPVDPGQIANVWRWLRPCRQHGFAAAPAGHARIGRSALHERITLGGTLRLRLDDVDVQAGVPRIRESKFHKSRLVCCRPWHRLNCTIISRSATGSLAWIIGRTRHCCAIAATSGGPQKRHAASAAWIVRNGRRAQSDGRCPRP